MDIGDSAGEGGMDDDALDVADDEQRRVLQGRGVDLELLEGLLEVLARALVFPAVAGPLPDIGPAVPAPGLLGALLEAVPGPVGVGLAGVGSSRSRQRSRKCSWAAERSLRVTSFHLAMNWSGVTCSRLLVPSYDRRDIGQRTSLNARRSGSSWRMARRAEGSMTISGVDRWRRNRGSRRRLWDRAPADWRCAGDLVEPVGQTAALGFPLQSFQPLAQGLGDGCGLGLAGQARDAPGEALGLRVTDVESHGVSPCRWRLG